MNCQKKIFDKNKVKHAILVLFIFFIVIFFIGIVGYKYVFGMSPSDAFFNTSLTVSNLGIGLHEKTATEKIFTAIYSLLTGILFVSLVSSIVAYIFTMYLESR